MGFNGLVFDFDGTGPIMKRFLPLETELFGRAGVAGVGQTGLSLARLGSLFDPLVAVTNWGIGGLRWLGETVRDATARRIFRIGGARIPAVDPSFVIRRTEGPGVHGGYFFEVNHDTALATMLAQMEIANLNEYQRQMNERINAPTEAAEAFFAPIEVLLGGDNSVRPNNRSPVFEPIRRTADEQRDMLRKAINERNQAMKTLLAGSKGGAVKMSAEALEKAVAEGAVLAEQYFNERVFPRMTEQERDAFWTSHHLTRNDWLGLGKSLLASTFGDEVLVPMETTAKSFHIRVQPAGVGDMVERVLTGANLDLNRRPLPSWKAAPDRHVKPTVPAIGGEALCTDILAAYGAKIRR
jgi:hypothetical protein